MSAGAAPDEATARARRRAVSLVESGVPGARVAVSPLGAGWSNDVDVYVEHEPPPGRLRELGWLPLDPLLARIGSPGAGRWLVMDGDEPLAVADIKACAPPDPVAAVLQRVRRRGEVRLREVLELRLLGAAGHPLPESDPAVRVAAAGPGATLPVPLRSALRRRVSAWRRALRPRAVVAISGVDGAGKSTLAGELVAGLARAGVPAERVWTRPGMRLGLLARLAGLAKRIFRDQPEPGIRRVAEGADGGTVRSRRGAVGWLWSLMVTLAFLLDVRRRHLAAQGVVVYDRHVLDAMATLRFGYAGVDTRVHEALIRRVLPGALVTFYLDVGPEVAVARKPGDVFGAHAVTRQLEVYAEVLATVPGVVVLDAQRPPRELVHEVLRRLVGAA